MKVWFMDLRLHIRDEEDLAWNFSSLNVLLFESPHGRPTKLIK